jgi:transcriptional regulator with XRE-family HTH domain
VSEDWLTEADQVEQAWLALGRQLAACRKAAGLTQVQLAALAGYSRSTVANVETGSQRVRPEFWARCDEVLGAGGALRRSLADVRAAEQSQHTRTAALARYQNLAAALSGQGDDFGPVPDPTAGSDAADDAGLVLEAGSQRDPAVVSLLADALGGHARTAAMFGGREMLPLMMRHARFLRAGFGSTCGRDRERLAGVSARYAEFLGWLCQDLGQWGDALFWSDRALEWAREAADNGLVSYILMRQSDLAEGHRPASTVLNLATAAGSVPALGPRSRALAVQQQATGHALSKDVAGFERMMDLARRDAQSAALSDDAPWGLYCTPVYVAMQEASGWIQLGNPGKAVTVFEREISGLPATDRVDAALFRARLARAYALDGQMDCAATAALVARELAAATGSWRARCELTRVRKLIGRHPRTAAAARFAAIFDTTDRPATAASGRP